MAAMPEELLVRAGPKASDGPGGAGREKFLPVCGEGLIMSSGECSGLQNWPKSLLAGPASSHRGLSTSKDGDCPSESSCH